MTAAEHQPRYVAYARSQGRDPESQLCRDRARWPGGRLTGFVTWLDARWREWSAEVGRPPKASRSDAEHDAFDAWLDEWSRTPHEPVDALPDGVW